MPKKLKPVRIDGDLAYITLSKGYEAVIDLADLPLVGMSNWCALVGPNTVYAVRALYDRRDGRLVSKTMTRLHSVILNAPKGINVDHINGNGLDNRRSNLRLATVQQNGCNRAMSRNNTSGYKGVTLCTGKWSTGKWKSEIKVNMKGIYLGVFRTKEEAHKAYQAASVKYHGEFGRSR